MKRRQVHLIALGIVLCLALLAPLGCGQQPASAPAPTGAPAPAPIAKPSPAATSAAPAPAAAGKTYKWKIQAYGGPGHETTAYIETFMAKVKEKSGGRVQFDYFPNAALYNPYEAFDALGKGILDFANCLNYNKPTPLADLNTAPFLCNNEKFYQNYKEPGSWTDFCKPYFENYGVKQVSRHVYGTQEVCFSKPAKGAEWTMEDFQGRIISTSASLKRTFELWGAKVAVLPGEERYDAVQRGTIDGLTGSTSSIVNARYYEVGPNIPVTSVFPGSMDFGMNLKLYNSLDADMKKIVDDAALDADAELARMATANWQRDLQTLKNNPKNKVYMVSDKEMSKMRAALDPLWKEWEAKYGDAYRQFDKVRNTFLW